jgi:hypothetical protein
MASVTVASAVSILLAALVIHFKAYGSYANVVVAAFLLEFWSQLLICSAIAFSALTGTTNVFAAPEYSFHSGPVAHIFGHLTGVLGSGTLFGAATGCLLLWMLRRLVPVPTCRTDSKTTR